MKKVNHSHLKRHCNFRVSHDLMNMLQDSYKFEIKPAVVGYIKHGVKTYSQYRKIRYFCPVEALEIVERKKSYVGMGKTSKSYDEYIEILKGVIEDREEYGDMIPDTSDIWNEEYNPKPKPKASKERLATFWGNKVNNRKERQQKFLKKWRKQFAA